jgi:DNA-binding LytR/AlgR family response regulator
MNYLIKPINEEKVFRCMDRIKTRKNTDDSVLLHCQDDLLKLSAGHISYVEARGHGSVIKADDEVYEIKESISEMEEMLRSCNFIKCHRSYLCSIIHIHHMDKTDIYMDDKSKVPISRRMYKDVNRAFIEYFRKN